MSRQQWLELTLLATLSVVADGSEAKVGVICTRTDGKVAPELSSLRNAEGILYSITN